MSHFRDITNNNFGDNARIHQGDIHNHAPCQADPCLADLRITDPRDDKIRIEETGGGLLRDSYCWILDNANFKMWHNDPQCRLLWIKGDPGQGKTMLLCGIIDELTPSTKLAGHVDGALLSYFFCQATDSRINSATAVLRSLIYLLIKQQPSLCSHVRTRYNDAGKALFEDANAWVALSEILVNILLELSQQITYLIIDAFDECIEGGPRLLDLIVKISAWRYVKWIVSSRTIPDIKQNQWPSLEVKEKYWYTTRDTTLHLIPGGIKSSSDGYAAADNTLKGHTSGVNSIAFSPNGKLLASASDDGTVRLWDATTSVERFVLLGHIRRVNAVVFSPDGTLLASASNDGTVRLWDTSIGKTRMELAGHGGWIVSGTVNAVAFSPDGELVVSGSDDTTARLWSTSTGETRFTLKGHDGTVRAVAFSSNGELVATASYGGTVQLWNISNGERRFTLIGPSYYMRRTAGIPGGGRDVYYSKFFSIVNDIAFSPDGKLVVAAYKCGIIILWSTFTGAMRFTLKGHTESVNAVAFSPDGEQVVSGSNDSTVWIWSTSTGKDRFKLKGHTGSVSAVTFSPNGKLVASASYDKTIRLCDPLSGAERIFKGHNGWFTTGRVVDVAFSPDGKVLASASTDNTVRLWDPTI